MTIKSILCLFGGSPQEVPTLEAALDLAHAFSAHVRILHCAAPPILYTATMGESRAYFMEGEGAACDILEKEARALHEFAWDTASKLTESHRVPLPGGSEARDTSGATASFRMVIGNAASRLEREGASVDLVVLGIDQGSACHLDALLPALFKTAVPILTMPQPPKVRWPSSGLARTIVIAWDGSQGASRALHAALPHLELASSVYLVSVEGMDDRPDRPRDEDVIAYLHHHDVAAEFIYSERVQHSVGYILLEKAADLNADLIVMGAYGNGHLGEMVLGGVSDYVIKHSGIPMLLTH